MWHLPKINLDPVVLVGCGGTGSFVAEGLCRLLPLETSIILVDHDRVEPHNLLRQNFCQEDLGKVKSQALAERLTHRYNRAIGYSVAPFHHDEMNQSWGPGMSQRIQNNLYIGCVDNAAARRQLSEVCRWGTTWWLDAGNGNNSGQVLIGNTNGIQIDGSFLPAAEIAKKLPSPGWQSPSLLIPAAGELAPRPDCAERVETGEQSAVINQAMATLTLEFVRRLLAGNLPWMGAYLDLDVGMMQTVPCDPATVARILKIRVERLLAKFEKERTRVKV